VPACVFHVILFCVCICSPVAFCYKRWCKYCMNDCMSHACMFSGWWKVDIAASWQAALSCHAADRYHWSFGQGVSYEGRQISALSVPGSVWPRSSKQFFYTMSTTPCPQKNIPNIFDCNSKTNYLISIIFGMNIPDTTCHQMSIQFPTSPNVCFCSTWLNITYLSNAIWFLN